MRKIDFLIIEIAILGALIIALSFALNVNAQENLATMDDVTKVFFFQDEIEEEIEIAEPELVSLGRFRITAYCSCEKCCDGWAKKRPKDENGNPIIVGATGEVLEQGVSIAVDKDVIPYGTKVMIAGKEYMAHDCGGAIKGNRIDVYHSTHSSAKEFGVQYAEVFIKGD